MPTEPTTKFGPIVALSPNFWIDKSKQTHVDGKAKKTIYLLILAMLLFNVVLYTLISCMIWAMTSLIKLAMSGEPISDDAALQDLKNSALLGVVVYVVFIILCDYHYIQKRDKVRNSN